MNKPHFALCLCYWAIGVGTILLIVTSIIQLNLGSTSTMKAEADLTDVGIRLTMTGAEARCILEYLNDTIDTCAVTAMQLPLCDIEAAAKLRHCLDALTGTPRRYKHE